MDKKLFKLISNLTVNGLKKVADSTSASACFSCYYQPKEPKSLKKE